MIRGLPFRPSVQRYGLKYTLVMTTYLVVEWGKPEREVGGRRRRNETNAEMIHHMHDTSYMLPTEKEKAGTEVELESML